MIAEAWHCRPSEVDEEDENDVELQKLIMRERKQFRADQEYLKR